MVGRGLKKILNSILSWAGKFVFIEPAWRKEIILVWRDGWPLHIILQY